MKIWPYLAIFGHIWTFLSSKIAENLIKWWSSFGGNFFFQSFPDVFLADLLPQETRWTDQCWTNVDYRAQGNNDNDDDDKTDDNDDEGARTLYRVSYASSLISSGF